MSTRKTLETADTELTKARVQYPVGSFVQHYKGTVYQIVDHALREEDLTVEIIYEEADPLPHNSPNYTNSLQSLQAALHAFSPRAQATKRRWGRTYQDMRAASPVGDLSTGMHMIPRFKPVTPRMAWVPLAERV